MPTNLSIDALLVDVVGSTGHRYAVTDSVGKTMDTVKIITNPAGGYLGVYHTGNKVNLATSTDLLNWVFRRTLDAQATQPTICALPTGGFLTAAEYNDQAGSGGLLRFRHYPNLSALLAGTFNRERTIPRSLSACNEGTPNIYSVSLTPDIDHSIIDIGFHYQRDCDLDRQARGRLTNFTTWTAAADPGADDRLTAAAAAQGRAVNGNIGDRDTAMFDNTRYTVHEVQYVKNDFGSWRLYLHKHRSGAGRGRQARSVRRANELLQARGDDAGRSVRTRRGDCREPVHPQERPRPSDPVSTRSPPSATRLAVPRATSAVSSADRPPTEPRPTATRPLRNPPPLIPPVSGSGCGTPREPTSGQHAVNDIRCRWQDPFCCVRPG